MQINYTVLNQLTVFNVKETGKKHVQGLIITLQSNPREIETLSMAPDQTTKTLYRLLEVRLMSAQQIPHHHNS